jgi:hypothetical protein
MHFGLFIEELRCGVDDATGFREHFEFVDGAEASGVGRDWLGKIHSIGIGAPGRSPYARRGAAISVLPLSQRPSVPRKRPSSITSAAIGSTSACGRSGAGASLRSETSSA